MTKAEILAQIKRTASKNGGVPLGTRTFARETGIRPAAWFGIHWRSWGDAVKEAGFAPNSRTPKIEERELLRRYCLLARELARFPTKGDFRLKKREDSTFPSESAFIRRFGSFPATRHRAREYSVEHAEFSDVQQLLSDAPRERMASPSRVTSVPTGFVYLVKHGSRSEYKIGKTFNRLRREGEIRLQLPEKLNPIHYIETDDPAGVEVYWHTRFAAKRKEGEWFALSRDDVVAFKRWKRIT
jgi:hypothetical protein